MDNLDFAITVFCKIHDSLEKKNITLCADLAEFYPSSHLPSLYLCFYRLMGGICFPCHTGSGFSFVFAPLT